LLILVGGAIGGSIIGGMIDPVRDLLVAVLGLDRVL